MAVFTAHIYGLYTAVYMARTRLCTVMYMGCKHSHVHGTGPCTRQGAFTAVYTAVSVNVAVYTSGKTAVDGPT